MPQAEALTLDAPPQRNISKFPSNRYEVLGSPCFERGEMFCIMKSMGLFSERRRCSDSEAGVYMIVTLSLETAALQGLSLCSGCSVTYRFV